MSNVIKPHRYVALSDKKRIKVRPNEPVLQHDERQLKPTEHSPNARGEADAVQRAEHERQKLMQQAKEQAEEIVQQAQMQAEQIKEQAQQEIESWWVRRREEDEQHIAEAREDGKQAGLQEGLAEAEKKVYAAYEDKLSQAQQIVEQAYEAKNNIIHEAEPFLLELSIEIAQKILGKQLTIERDWVLDGIKRIMKRRKEQGAVTLCVSPEQFEWVNDAREELLLALDSEADLQIIPDPRVQDHGCIVRSAYGSIDARLDTQLTEMKRALLEIARSPEEAEEH